MKKKILSLMAISCLTASAQFGAPRENPKVPSVVEGVVEDLVQAVARPVWLKATTASERLLRL